MTCPSSVMTPSVTAISMSPTESWLPWRSTMVREFLISCTCERIVQLRHSGCSRSMRASESRIAPPPRRSPGATRSRSTMPRTFATDAASSSASFFAAMSPTSPSRIATPSALLMAIGCRWRLMRGSRSSRPWICLVIDSRGVIDPPFARRAASFMPSFRADIVFPHHLAPSLDLLDDPLLRRLWAERHHVHAQRLAERLVDLRELDRLHELGVQLVDDGPRRARRREDAPPGMRRHIDALPLQP